MKIRVLIVFMYVLLGILFQPFTSISAQEANLTKLDALIEHAVENNPKIEQAFNAWESYQYKTKHVKVLPDPIASYGYFGENVETRVGPQEHKYGVSQKIPFPGKLHLKGKAQAKQSQVFENRYEATKREVIKDVKFLYYDLFWMDMSIQTAEEEKMLLENLEKVIRRKYEVNKASLQDVTRVQIELSKLIDKLFLLNQNRKSIQARVNSMLNRERGSEIPSIQDIPQQVELSYTLDELIVMAEESRQELLGANLSVEKAEHEKSLARLDYLPDFTFGVEYTEIGAGTTTHVNDGQDAWMAKVSVNVPIWFHKLDAQLNEKKASLKAAENSLENLQNTVSYEVQDIYFKMNAYSSEVELYETALIPQAEQSFESIRTSYISGKVGFLDWLEAERTLLQTKISYYKSISDYHKSMAYLERVVGRDL